VTVVLFPKAMHFSKCFCLAALFFMFSSTRIFTHVVVTFNKDIQQGFSRARYFLPECEFLHGLRPIYHKYPNLRASVWTDNKSHRHEESGMSELLPAGDTDTYDFVSPAPVSARGGEFDCGSASVANKVEPVSKQPPDTLGDCEFESSDASSECDSCDVYECDSSSSEKSEVTAALDKLYLAENAWVNAPLWRKEELYYELRDTEVEYALTAHIYKDLVTGFIDDG
jgi:hypothetical protein